MDKKCIGCDWEFDEMFKCETCFHFYCLDCAEACSCSDSRRYLNVRFRKEAGMCRRFQGKLCPQCSTVYVCKHASELAEECTLSACVAHSVGWTAEDNCGNH